MSAPEPFVLLVKLGDKNIKLTFSKRPKLADVAAQVHKTAKLGPEMLVVLAAPDPDFPGDGDVLLPPDAELKQKQVLSATAQLKEVHSWDDVHCPEAGKAVLRDSGISPNVASHLVHTLGYAEPNDLRHLTEELLAKLPLKPLEKNRLLKLAEGAKGGAAISPRPVAPPSARPATKLSPVGTGGSGASTPPAPSPRTGNSQPGATRTSNPTAKPTAAQLSGVAAVKTKAGSIIDKGSSKPGGDASVPTGKEKRSVGAGGDGASPSAPGTPTSAAADTPPATLPPPSKPPADEDDDEMLARILAEGREEDGARLDAAAGLADLAQSKFSSPIRKSELVATLEGHTDSVLSLAITPDNKTLFSGSGDNSIKVWNLRDLILIDTLTAHNASVGVLCMHPTGHYLISGSADGNLVVWGVLNGKATLYFSDTDSHAYGIMAMTIANSQNMLFTATGDKKIRGFEIDFDGQCLSLAMELSGHLDSIRSMVLSPDDLVLYSASEDATIKEWHADEEVGYRFVRALRGHEAAVYGLAISADGSTLISCSADKTITLWTIPGRKGSSKELIDGPVINQVLTGHRGDINCVALDERKRRIYSTGDDKTVRIWGQLTKGKEQVFALQQTLEGHALIVYPIKVASDGRTVVSGSADNTVRVWALHD